MTTTSAWTWRFRGVELGVAPGVHPAQARRVPEDPLVERPQGARPDERLVVEADGQQPVEAVGQREQVRRIDGHAFCGRTCMPSWAGVDARPDVGAGRRRRPGSSGSGRRQQRSPRGRWYLKLRDRTSTPSAASAEPTVSPSQPRRRRRPSNVKPESRPRPPSSAGLAGAGATPSGRSAIDRLAAARPPVRTAVVAGVALRLEPAPAAGRWNHQARSTPSMFVRA